MPCFELFLRRWVATFLLLPTAAFSGDWVAFTGMVCLSALSDLIASRYVAMVPVQVFSNDPGFQDGYAPLVPDRATHRTWYWLSVGALLIVWVGCLSTLSSPGKTMTGHIAFWCVYVLVPPLTAYTTRIAACWVSQRRHKDASFTLRDAYATEVYTAPGALLRDRIGMQQSALPLVLPCLLLGALFGGTVVTLIAAPGGGPAVAQLLWLCPACLLMLLMAGAGLVRLPELVYLSRRAPRLQA